MIFFIDTVEVLTEGLAKEITNKIGTCETDENGKVFLTHIQIELVAVNRETMEIIAYEAIDDEWNKVDWNKCEKCWMIS